MTSPQSELADALSSLCTSGRYSDLTIVCGAHKYPVHKALLCTRSSFFEGACNGRFSESRTGEIDLSEEDEVAVQHMVHYFYHLDYLSSSGVAKAGSDGRELKHSPEAASQVDFETVEDPLLATAAASSVRTLQQAAAPSVIPMQGLPLPTAVSRQWLSKPLSGHSSSQGENSPLKNRSSRLQPNTGTRPDSSTETATIEDSSESSDLVIHARVYALAEMYGIQGLKTLAQEKFEASAGHRFNESAFLRAAEEAYTATMDNDRGLRNVVLQSFRQRPELVVQPAVQQMAHNVPSLAFDLYRMSSGIPIPL